MTEIIKNYDDADCVSGLKGYVSDDNQVTLSWDWPENEEYDLCVVFAMEQEGETLEMLLDREAKRTVYANAFGACHKEKITTGYTQFKVYPAKKKNGQFYIVDQKAKNVSEAFYKKLRVRWKVEYDRPKMFASYRRARILLSGLEQVADGYLCYRCAGGGKDGLVYGIDLGSFAGRNGFEVVVGKNETVEVFLEKGQSSRLELIKC